MEPTVTSVTLLVNPESFNGALMAPKGTDVLLPIQCRAARAALRITVDELAALAQVSRMTIMRFETEKTSPIAATAWQIRKALEDAGAEFPDLETVRFPRSDKVPAADAEDGGEPE